MNEAYIQMGRQLKEELDEIEAGSGDLLLRIEEAIGLCTVVLLEIKDRVIKEGFNSVESEVHFFKQVKPSVYCHLIYYLKRMKLEILRPALGREAHIAFLEKTIHELESYYQTHGELYKYYRLKRTDRDDQYFRRHSNYHLTDIEHIYQVIDGLFTAPRDHIWASFRAHERLIQDLESEVEELIVGDKRKDRRSQEQMQTSEFRWTESKVALVELIYAIHSAHSINDGQFNIKKMVKLFETIFHIELGDAYRIFLEIRNRKVERTKYLDLLKIALIKRMDSWDNRDVNAP